MKLRWHLLSLLLASIVTGIFWSWPRTPVWLIEDYRTVRSAGVDSARNEWHTLVCDSNKANWKVETRSDIESRVIRSVPLALPALKGVAQYVLREKDASVEAPLVFVDHHQSNPVSGFTVEERVWLLDSQTGQLLRQEPIFPLQIEAVAQHRDRLAIGGSDRLWLIEGKADTGRTVPLKGPMNLKFSPDGRWLACTDYASQLSFIDWKSGSVIRPLNFTKLVYSFGFITDETLVLSMSDLAGQDVSRWRWDGEMLHQLSPGIVLPSNMWPLFFKSDPSGMLHVCVYSNEEWPWQMKLFFTWLEKHHVPVARWFPRKLCYHWHVLDDKDRRVREYDEPDNSKDIRLKSQYAVEIRRVDQSSATMIALWNTSPLWPNTLALGMVLYLLLYVMIRIFYQMDKRNRTEHKSNAK